MQYVSDAGAHHIIPATTEPKNHFERDEECEQLALDQEIKVSKLIYNLVDLAAGQNDHLTLQFLQLFVTEQLEEVASMSDLLATIRRACEANLLQVEDFLARNPHPAAGGEG
jgi:ferritin